MPESSFPSAQQLATTEIDGDSPLTDAVLEKYRLRDVTLIDQMAKLGAPTSVGSGSAIAYEGDVTIAANQTLEGLHYYNNLTINGGVTVTVDKYLLIVAKGTVTIAGTVNANGQGAPGGTVNTGKPGTDGRGGTGGGGGAGVSTPGKGGDCVIGTDRVAGGAAGVGAAGVAGTALTARIKGGIVSAIRESLHGGAGGGCGGVAADATGRGGAGGGVVIIIAPTVVLTGGIISANGAAGLAGDTNGGGGGGGGAGVIVISCKSYTGGALTITAGAGGAGNGSGFAGGPGGAGVVQIDIYS